MKQNKRTIAVLLVLLTLLTLFPVNSLAEYKVKPIQYNKWYSLKDSSSDMTIYKIVITTDTALIFNWKNYNDDTFGYGALYYDAQCNRDVSMDTTILGVDTPSKGIKGYVLYRGTYYLRMYDSGETAKVKISKKRVSDINKPNYTISKATTMKKGKKYEFAQTNKDFYRRWYKIKLTQSQVISIYGYDGYYEFYDKNFNEIRCTLDYENDIIKTDGVQPKGTYYLVFYDYISSVLKSGTYYNIYWK